MGVFEKAQGLIVIPTMLITLMILAKGTGRRQMSGLINKIFGVHFDVAGIRIQFIPLMVFVNLIYIANCFVKIDQMNEAKAADEADGHKDIIQGAYQQQLLHLYRNLMMNVCCMVLLSCISICTWQYSNYVLVKDKLKDEQELAKQK